MKALNQRGDMNVLLIPFILMTLFFLGASGFALWAFTSREDYKNNSDQKVAAAVEVAKQETATAKDNEFVEKEKYPLKPYVGPATFGSVSIQYPKTWSAYVNESGSGNTPLNGYFHPNFVPGTDSGTGFALRIEVSEASYPDELRRFDGAARSGMVRVNPYAAPKVPGVVGARVDGEIISKKKGSMVLLPLRDKTLKVWTEADQFQKEYNEIILASLTFTP
jgi:hypothetical protein